MKDAIEECDEDGDAQASHMALPAEAERRKNREKDRYRVEIAMSPGNQVFEDGCRVPWPDGNQFTPETCIVSPLEIIADSVELNRIERLFSEAVKEYGTAFGSDEDADDGSADCADL